MFIARCVVRDLSSLGIAVITPPCQAGLERASWIKRQMFLSPQVIPYVQPAKMNVPDCTPEYKICEWNDDKTQNFPLVTKQREVVLRFVQASGKQTKNCIDERYLKLSHCQLTVTQTNL